MTGQNTQYENTPTAGEHAVAQRIASMMGRARGGCDYPADVTRAEAMLIEERPNLGFQVVMQPEPKAREDLGPRPTKGEREVGELIRASVTRQKCLFSDESWAGFIGQILAENRGKLGNQDIVRAIADAVADPPLAAMEKRVGLQGGPGPHPGSRIVEVAVKYIGERYVFDHPESGFQPLDHLQRYRNAGIIWQARDDSGRTAIAGTQAWFYADIKQNYYWLHRDAEYTTPSRPIRVRLIVSDETATRMSAKGNEA